jgi:sugar fermentation stimulation protein A
MDHAFQPALVEGHLLRRYKRFLADVRLEDGTEIVAHCPNTGSMRGCAIEGSPVWLSRASNPQRKLPFTWELVESEGVLIGVHPALANRVVESAIGRQAIPSLADYAELRREVRYGERSRIDMLLTDPERPPCYIEVKSVTLAEDGVARFPDAVTTRGRRHLEELMAIVGEGKRAVSFHLVVRGDCAQFGTADTVDPEYGKTLRKARAAGVEVMAWQASVAPEGIRVERELPIVLEPLV